MSHGSPVNRGEEVASQSWAPNVCTFRDSTVQQVAGADQGRRSLTFIADSQNTSRIYLLASANGVQANGLALDPGSAFSMNTAGAVYAVCPAGDGSTLCVVTETGAVC